MIRRLTASLVLTAATVLAGAGVAAADVSAPGHYCSIRDGAAVREQPGGAARDNLGYGQTFQVESHATETYVYGHKIVNGVHGWVLSSSLDPC